MFNRFLSMKIVITGGSKGIGKAIALEFAKNGFDIAICGRNILSLESLKNEINNLNNNIKCHIFSCDVSIKSEIIAFGHFVIENLGVPDVIVNNAGVFIPGEIYNEEDGLLEKMIETYLYSAYYFTKTLLPQLMAQKRGQIFNIASIAGIKAYANGGSYSISKFALMGFSKNLREELKPFNIKVCAVLPGAVLTDAWGIIDFPEERLMPVEDIAKSIYDIYSLSDRTVVEEIILRPMLGDL